MLVNHVQKLRSDPWFLLCALFAKNTMAASVTGELDMVVMMPTSTSSESIMSSGADFSPIHSY